MREGGCERYTVSRSRWRGKEEKLGLTVSFSICLTDPVTASQ